MTNEFSHAVEINDGLAIMAALVKRKKKKQKRKNEEHRI